MNEREAASWLEQRQFFTIKLGLETTRALLTELGTPQDRLRIIHIAGTNGKGSVAATLCTLLGAAGIRTGLYTSPHLSSVRERFRINGECITAADFARLVSRLAAYLGDRPLPTYFECTTLLALLWFAEQQVEAVILETGMGGRLDATNVVTPLVTILTDISHDHEQYLGSTLEAIAGEKAGIIKPGIPVVFSGRAPETVPVIEARCRQQHSPLFLHGRHFCGTRSPAGGFDYRTLSGTVHAGLPLTLAGEHQVVNTSLALAALELLDQIFPCSPEAVNTGLRRVHWPGRMELIPIRHGAYTLHLLLDGAHNEAGVTALVTFLRDTYPHRRLLLVWGNMADKRLGPAFHDLLARAEVIVLTRAESQRSASPAALFTELPSQARPRTRCAETVEEALALVQQAATPEDLICVAGSLYLVGRVRSLLLGEPAG